MAVKGSCAYKKALTFNVHEWDSVKMAPKYTGNSIEDCIKYVRRKMFIKEKKPKENDNEGESEADSENEDVLLDNTGGKEVEITVATTVIDKEGEVTPVTTVIDK